VTRQELQTAISTLDGLQRELIIKKGKDPGDKKQYYLYPPASLDEIQRAEAKEGHAYSPLYREFLTLHNGWFRFWPSWSLVGIRRDDNVDAYDHIDEALRELHLVVTPSDLLALPMLEKEKPERILITNHLIISTDFNGNFLLLDQNRIDVDGEPEVAWVVYLNHVERRWKNFAQLLQNAITSTRMKLQS
jgi:SMI1/KNR4 family protein SUKH-1